FDFGDGTVVGPQPGAIAVHTYTRAGSFQVRVTATDAAGLTSSATATVGADASPIARLTVSPSSGVTVLTVKADASATTDVDSTPIASYTFDFGSGIVAGPQSTPTAVHLYGTAGVYLVVVTVTDTAGFSSTASATVTVVGNLVGNPGFESGTAGCNTGGNSLVALTQAVSGHSGNFSAQHTNIGSVATACILNDAPNSAINTPLARAAFGKDSSATGYDLIAANGFETVTASTDNAFLDGLAARGLKAMVWLGAYDNTACAWQYDDTWVTTHVTPLAGHPG